MDNDTNNRLPFISIVIPVYNGEAYIGKTVEALLEQTLPREQYEIIVVNNNSSDNTAGILKSYPVQVVDEKECQGPDPSRNTGVGYAKGEIIAFIDSDCKAESNWLEQGIKAMEDLDASLVAGEVAYELPARPAAAEIYEYVEEVRNKETVSKRNVAGGGNLFVKREVFDKGINFSRELPSGGDTFFTASVAAAGFRLGYSNQVVVYHPLHTFKSLLKKFLRTGAGKVTVWKLANKEKKMNKSLVGQQGASRLNPFLLWKRIKNAGLDVGYGKFVQVYLFTYVYIAVFISGMFLGLLRNPRSVAVNDKRGRRKSFYPW